jgi:molybdopterin-guanine dinucleotide biosynthesis protein
MRERAFVHVAGPSGAGKTTLIERLLASNRSKLLMVARGVLDDAMKRSKVSTGRTDDELNRLREAGASNVARYRFPSAERGTDAFFCSDFMNDYSEGVLIEGDSPLGFPPDLAVFVARPVPEGESLLCRANHARQLEKLRAITSPTGDHAGFVRAMVEAGLDRSLRDNASWSLAEGFAGIEHAQVVVINVGSPAERARGEAMLPDLARLREDREVFDDVIGWRGNRLSITVGVADLADPKDKETKRLLNRIKRAFARRA